MPQMMNIGSLMLLCILIYSLFGINLFGQVKQNSPMNEHINFESLENAFIVLIRVATGEGWNDL